MNSPPPQSTNHSAFTFLPAPTIPRNFDFTYAYPRSSSPVPSPTPSTPSSLPVDGSAYHYSSAARGTPSVEHGLDYGHNPLMVPRNEAPSPPIARADGPAGPEPTFRSSPPHTLRDVLPPIFVDTLAQDLNLGDWHRGKLRAFVALGSTEPPLSRTDLATRTFLLAAILWTDSERTRQAQASTTEDIAKDLPGMVADLKIRLEDSFTLTKEQKENVRCVTQDIIYQSNRFTFKTLYLDVEKSLREDQAVLRLTNVFTTPAREKAALSFIRKTCSSVRNALRQDIRDSVLGDKKCSLEEFTVNSAMKYKRGGAGEKLEIGFTLHNAVLRRFALDNPELLNYEEDEDGNIVLCTTTTGPAHKKRKTSANGRVPQGQDFWSKVDGYFTAQVRDYGRNLASQSWKPVVDDIVRRDQRAFPAPGSSWSQPQAPSVPTALSYRVDTAGSSAASSSHDLVNLLN